MSETAFCAATGTTSAPITRRTASSSSASRSLKMSTDVLLLEDGDLDAPVRLAAQEPLADQDLGRGAERVAGDAEPLGELVLAQARPGLELAVEDQLAQGVGGGLDGRDGRDGYWLGRQIHQSCVTLFHNSTTGQLWRGFEGE